MNLFHTVKVTAEALMYVGIFTMLIFGVLTIINYKVVPILPFLPTDKPVLASPSVNSITAHLSKAAPSDTLLHYKSNSSTLKFNLTKFSINFDCFLNGTYKSTDVPRVLLYFDLSSNPTSSKKITSNSIKEYKEDTPLLTFQNADASYMLNKDQTDLLDIFSNTNFIVYMDSVKNDMKVALITTDSTDYPKIPKYLEVLPIITNVPINAPFQITLVFTNNIVEVYRDKQLLFTYTIKHKRILIPTGPETNGLYSPIGYIGNTVQLANIQYFDNSITSSQVRTLTNTLSAQSVFN